MISFPDDIKQDLMDRLIDAREYKDGIKACCPYHDERTASFYVSYYSKTNAIIGKCFGCGKAVGLNGLLVHLRSSLRHAALPQTYVGTNSQQEQESSYRPDDTAGYAYDEYPFSQRGISGSIVQQFGFRVDYNSPALVFPVYHDGEYHGWIKRLLDPSAAFKYMIQPGLPIKDVVWGYDAAKESSSSDTLYVTEGIVDAACLWSQGKEAIALLGKHPRKLLKLEPPPGRSWCLVPDNGDNASIQSFLEVSLDLCCGISFLPADYKDVSDMVERTGTCYFI